METKAWMVTSGVSSLPGMACALREFEGREVSRQDEDRLGELENGKNEENTNLALEAPFEPRVPL